MVQEQITKTILGLIVIISVAVLVIIGIFLFGALGDIPSSGSNSSSESYISFSNINHTISPTEEGIDTFVATRNNESWLEFDGINDVVVSPSLGSYNLSNGFSLSSWARAESSNTTSGSDSFILRNSNITGAYPYFQIGIRDNNPNGGLPNYKARIQLNSSGCDETAYAATSTVVDGEWYHIVGIINKTHIKIYLNGVLGESDAITQACRVLLQSMGIFEVDVDIGQNSNGGGSFDGGIDESRIYNRTLSQAEITEIYNSGRTSNSSLPSDDLVVWYSYNEESGPTLFDKSGNGRNGV